MANHLQQNIGERKRRHTTLPGHVSPQSTNQRCEVLRLDGPQQGQLTVVVKAADGTMETRHTLRLNFEPSPEAATMSGTLVLGAGAVSCSCSLSPSSS